MAFVVTDNCQKCRFTECVVTCPVACFHGDDEQLYIDPDVCIDCAACVPLCPVHAIYDQFDLEEDKLHWVEINAEKSLSTPVVDASEEPKAGAMAQKQALGF